MVSAADPQQDTSGKTGPAALKTPSLQELTQIEVTTASKEPLRAFQTPAAVYVITGGSRSANKASSPQLGAARR